ncbi:hypothetical protein F5Y04DRAFT_281254 [Hypomontagnella monticulosa]|nr:hypothetical protein F5Y04DRAFT_281254 [Hypomontagnella monticulosa]
MALQQRSPWGKNTAAQPPHQETNLMSFSDDEGKQLILHPAPQAFDSLIGKVNGLWYRHSGNHSKFLDAIFALEHMGVKISPFKGLPSWSVPVPDGFDKDLHLGNEKHVYILSKRLRVIAEVNSPYNPTYVTISLDEMLTPWLEDDNKRFDAIVKLWDSYHFLCYWAFEAKTRNSGPLPILRALDLYMMKKAESSRIGVWQQITGHLVKQNPVLIRELPAPPPPAPAPTPTRAPSPAPTYPSAPSSRDYDRGSDPAPAEDSIVFKGKRITTEAQDSSASESSDSEGDDSKLLKPVPKVRLPPQQTAFVRKPSANPGVKVENVILPPAAPSSTVSRRGAPLHSQQQRSVTSRPSQSRLGTPSVARSVTPSAEPKRVAEARKKYGSIQSGDLVPAQPWQHNTVQSHPRQASAIPPHMRQASSSTVKTATQNTPQNTPLTTPTTTGTQRRTTTSGYGTPGEAIARVKAAGAKGEHKDDFRTWSVFFAKQLAAHVSDEPPSQWAPIADTHLLFVRILHQKFCPPGAADEAKQRLREWAVAMDDLLKAAAKKRVVARSEDIFMQALK